MASDLAVWEIKNKIHNVRGKQVMLDFDLAELFGSPTRDLNKRAKRNPNKFPVTSYFQLTFKESESLKIPTGHGGRRKLSYCFTLQSASLAAFVINTKRSSEVNLALVDAFILARESELTLRLITDKFDTGVSQLNTKLEMLGSIVQTTQTVHSATGLLSTSGELKRDIKCKSFNCEIDKIKNVVAEYFDLPLKTLTSARRHKKTAQARQIAMYLARKLTGSSFKDLGSEFGGKDHTTIIHACDKVEEALKSDLKIQEYISDIQARLEI